jgi:chromosome segregation ATPase
MVCSLVKKGVLGAALGAGALFLVFGISAPSYVRTAFHKARHSAQDRIPTQFQIDRARDEVANLEPAIIENRETLARAEVDVEHLENEIAATQANLAVEKRELLSLRDSVKNGDYRLAGHVAFSPEEIKANLASKLDHYKAVSRVIEEKEATLKARQKAVSAARLQMTNLVTAKRNLMTKLEGIEAKLRMIEATQGKNEFTFDDSALSRAKQTIADLEKRLEVKARVAEIEGRFSDGGLPVLEPGRDVVREIDAEFGTPVKGTETKTGDKSL